MATTLLVLLGLALIVGTAVWVVYGGGFRSGASGHPDGQWGGSGQRISGGMSPPFLLISSLLSIAVVLMVVAALMAAA
ncbi:MAG: hypothetical protein R3B59_01765 [Dehalococcoidia bacterium]